MRITEQRAISSKVSADGIGVFNAMAEVREWRGLRSGAKDVRTCFTDMKFIRIILPLVTRLACWRTRIRGPRIIRMWPELT